MNQLLKNGPIFCSLWGEGESCDASGLDEETWRELLVDDGWCLSCCIETVLVLRS